MPHLYIALTTHSLVSFTYLAFFITSELKVFATFDGKLFFVFTNRALKTKNDFFSSLSFFVENGFGLTTITGLFTIVTAFTLSENGGFTGFVL